MDLSNYHNKTLPNFAPVGYDEWLKKQNASKNTGASGSLNSGVFTDATSNAIREAAENAASQKVSQSVANQNFLFNDGIIPQGMADGFKEYQAEQAIKGGQTGKTGSEVTGGIPIAGFSPILDNAAKTPVASSTTKKTDTKKDTAKDEGKTEYVADAAATPNPADYGFSLDGYEGFSYGDFQVSDAYVKAMDYTNSLLSQLSSGRTSYTDQINALMGEYRNRDKFSYDASTDAMFQQMLAASMASGKMAMQDTIGQAAALTGGYGNTYGTAAGNAAYNQYISEAYNNLPEYYGMALDAYNMEGDRMLSELAMLQDADSAEYDRLANAYSANLGAANAMYDREYTQYMNDRNAAETDYWNDVQFRYGAYMDALNQANKDREFNYGVAMDKQAQENWERQFEYKAEQDEADRQYQVAQDALTALSGENETESYKEPTQTMYTKALEAYANGGDAGLIQYLETIPNYSVEDIDAYVEKYGAVEAPEKKTYTKTKDTKINGLGGVDRNDVVEDQYGNQYKLSELPAEVAKVLTELKKGESYDFSAGKKVK